MTIPEDLRGAIARAILDDETSQNGEHLFHGERLVFYCPMQAPEGTGRPAGVPVRDLLPLGTRIPTFTDYLAVARPGVPFSSLEREARSHLQRAYEAQTLAWLNEVISKLSG